MFIEELEDTKDFLTIHQLEDELRDRGFTGRLLYGETMKYELDEFRTLLVTYYNNYTLHESKWFLRRGLIPRRRYFHIEYMLGYSGGSICIANNPYEAQQAINTFITRMNNPTSKDGLFINSEKQRVEKLLGEF